MVSVHETAYPRLKNNPTARELQDIYTSNAEELAFAGEKTRQDGTYVLFVITLKTFQRLGYFIKPTEIPMPIAHYIARQVGGEIAADDLVSYDKSASRSRHRDLIRTFVGIQAYHQAQIGALLRDYLTEVAAIRDDVADLINLAVEELSRRRIELPAFRTLHDLAASAQVEAARQLYQRVYQALGEENRNRLAQLWTESEAGISLWEKVKTEPGKPTITTMDTWLARCEWLCQCKIDTQALEMVPEVKAREFAVEARALYVAEIAAVQNKPRLYTLALALWAAQVAQTLDDLGELYVKRMMNMHFKAKDLFVQHQQEQQAQVDSLVVTLRDLLAAQQGEGSDGDRLAAMDAVVGEHGPELLARCEAHLAGVEQNYRPWLLGFYRRARAPCFGSWHVCRSNRRCKTIAW